MSMDETFKCDVFTRSGFSRICDVTTRGDDETVLTTVERGKGEEGKMTGMFLTEMTFNGAGEAEEDDEAEISRSDVVLAASSSCCCCCFCCFWSKKIFNSIKIIQLWQLISFLCCTYSHINRTRLTTVNQRKSSRKRPNLNRINAKLEVKTAYNSWTVVKKFQWLNHLFSPDIKFFLEMHPDVCVEVLTVRALPAAQRTSRIRFGGAIYVIWI